MFDDFPKFTEVLWSTLQNWRCHVVRQGWSFLSEYLISTFGEHIKNAHASLPHDQEAYDEINIRIKHFTGPGHMTFRCFGK